MSQSHSTGDPIISSATLDYLEGMRDDWQIPGVSLAIVQMDEAGKWKQQTVGLGRMDSKGSEVTDQTLFTLASNSKHFTALAAGLALSQAGLTWETPVRSVIPSFQLMDKEAQEKITFIELLSHQSGLPRHDLSYDAKVTVEDMIDSLGHLKPSAPMKTLWQYNNITYAAASHLPKHLLGQDFDDFVKDKIWKPLGMDNTFYDIEAARATGHLVSGFARRITSDRTGIEDADVCRQDIEMRGGKLSDEGRGIEQEIGWLQEHWQGTAGAVGVISCARDMVIWLKTLLLNGRNPETDEQVVPQSILEDTVKPQIQMKSKSDDPEMTVPMYGLAQWTYKYKGFDVVEHTGAMPGQKSLIMRLPEKMIGVAIMVNDQQLGKLFNEVTKWRLVDDLLGLEPIDFKTRKLDRYLDERKLKHRDSKPPQPAPPTHGFASIPGVYHHPAYGSIELRPLTSASHQDDLQDKTPWTFVVDSDKSWVKEYLFEHFDGDVFNVTAKLVYPKTGAVIWDISGVGIRAKFGEGGVGFQHIWGAGEGIPDGNMERDGIRNGSEVFFAKV